MNIYCLVEGRKTEKIVYGHWIRLLNPNSRIADSLEDITKDSVYIFSGNGYPNYLNMIEDCLKDIAMHGAFDRFVISVDSEDMTCEDKRSEVQSKLAEFNPSIDTKIVVQHYCFETWALGNRTVGSKRPKDLTLAKYKKQYDVAQEDPALMPSFDPNLNRAQFSDKYLRLLLNDHNKNLTYSKANPAVVCHPKYFSQIKNRAIQTNHIATFNDFLLAFS